MPATAKAPAFRWYAVITPTVFKEYRLPVDENEMTRAHLRQWTELVLLANQHGTNITSTSYRRG